MAKSAFVPAAERLCCTSGCCRYTKDIPQQGSTSGQDGKPVIFPYIDLNIQTLQGNNQLRSSAAAAAGPPASYSQQPAPAIPSVTPGRPGPHAAQAPGNLAPDCPLVARLVAAFKRLGSNHQNAAERVRVASAGSLQCDHQHLTVPPEHAGVRGEGTTCAVIIAAHKAP